MDLKLCCPSGLQNSDTVEDAIRRADYLSDPNGTRYSAQLCTSKDLRRIVLLARELRNTRADEVLATLEAAIAELEKAVAVRDEAIMLATIDTAGCDFADALLTTLEVGNKWFGTSGWIVWLKRQADRLKQAKAALSPDQTGKAYSCEWTEANLWESEGVWDTECGHTFDFGEGGPCEDGINFCCYCGKKIVRIDAKGKEA